MRGDGGAARRRPVRGARDLRGDRARDGGDGPGDPAAGDGRTAGGLGRRPGQALPRLRRAAAGARGVERAGAAHLLRHVRAEPLPERAADPAQAARLAGGARDQRERHHHHGRDLVRRQRFPRRPGGDPARRRPAAAPNRHRRPLHGRPAAPPQRPPRARGHRLRAAREDRYRGVHIAPRVGQACARRWWRRRWPPRPAFPP